MNIHCQECRHFKNGCKGVEDTQSILFCWQEQREKDDDGTRDGSPG